MAIDEAEVDKLIKRRGCLTAIWILGFGGFLVAGLVVWTPIEGMGDSFCESAADSSNYGEMSWSLAPPGPQCTFTVESNGFDEVRRPSPLMSLWLTALVLASTAVLVVGAGVGIYLLRSPFNPDGSLRGRVPDGDEEPIIPGDRNVR
ncbi:MAG: hypothetical protein WBA45_02235 [Microthrixaceae bacterium]